MISKVGGGYGTMLLSVIEFQLSIIFCPLSVLRKVRKFRIRKSVPIRYTTASDGLIRLTVPTRPQASAFCLMYRLNPPASDREASPPLTLNRRKPTPARWRTIDYRWLGLHITYLRMIQISYHSRLYLQL
jgi:hypothetical protein